MKKTGSITANFHEGSRSEYLAQYVFASFGTAVAVPHQEDAGIDLHCTITEREGQQAWPRAYFTVQVKSNDDPWEFNDPNSVRWLLEHPIPLFLCVVHKKEARLCVYQTSPRLLAGLFPPLPAAVTLRPEKTTAGEVATWSSPDSYSLSAPILDFTVIELLDEERATGARACLREWATIDSNNIHRRASGVAAIELPSTYITNEAPSKSTGTMIGPPLPGAVPKLVELLEHIGTGYQRSTTGPDVTTAALVNMLHRQLTRPDAKSIPFINQKLNERMNLKETYLFAAVDRLIEAVRRDVDGSSGD